MLRHDLLFAAAIVAAVGMFAVTGGQIVAAAPLAALAAWLGVPFVAKIPWPLHVYIFVFLAFILDGSPKAFYEYEPITEIIGSLLFFGPLSKLVPGLPGISPFEILLLVFFGVCLVQLYLTRTQWVGVREFRENFATLALLVCILPAAAILGVVTGVLTDGSASMGFIQIRPFFLIPISAFVGFWVCHDLQVFQRIFWIASIALFLKSLQGFWAYFVFYKGNLGTHEYLLEHLTSDYIATAVTFLICVALLAKNSILKRLALFGILPIYLLPYLWNDRRASLLGVLLTAGLVPILFPGRVLLRALPWGVALGALFALYLAATWNMEGPLAFAARTLKSFLEPPTGVIDYRDVENFNLLRAIMNNPLLGFGYGKAIPFPFQTFDFASAYELFNVFPHNSLLSLWAFAGLAGIAALGTLIACAVSQVTRLVSEWRSPANVVIGIVGFTMLGRWLVFINADMALLDIRSNFLNALLIGGVFRLLAEQDTTARVKSVDQLREVMS